MQTINGNMGASTGKATRHRRRVVASGLALAIASVMSMSTAQALSFHVNGDKLYVSGGFELNDDQKLARLLDDAAAQGKTISAVVFRMSPGGNAAAAKSIGELIRTRGLNTVFQGGCYSACTAGFVGGEERRIAEYDLPDFHPNYGSNIFGIHGSGLGSEVSEDQSDIVAHYTQLLGGEIPPEAMERIVYAITHMEDTQAFLRYFDPTDTALLTTYCSTGNTANRDKCIQYPGVTIASDGVVNQTDRVDLSSDYLWIRDTRTGNVNPDFGSVNDAYGVIRIADGGIWQQTDTTGADLIAVEGGGVWELHPGMLSREARIELGEIKLVGVLTLPKDELLYPTANWSYVGDGGRIAMRGGRLYSNLLSLARAGGTVEGYGEVASNLSFGAQSRFRPEGIVVKPYLMSSLEGQGGIRRGDSDVDISLSQGSTVEFGVTPGTQQAALTLVEAEVMKEALGGFILPFGFFYAEENRRSHLKIADGVELALDVDPGFYASGHVTPLVESIIEGGAADPDGVLAAAGRVLGPDLAPLLGIQRRDSDTDFILGRFSSVVRAGDAGDRVDLTADDAVFRPRYNSLLSFKVHQSDEAIWLEAQRAFDDTAIFANAQSGDGLGVTLRDASDRENSPLQPVLGALQFADRDVARAQAGVLRGDGHASLRMADFQLVNSFGNAVGQHLASVRSRGEDGGGIVASGAYAGGAGALAGASGSKLSQLMMHFNDPGVATDTLPEDRETRVWARGFGQVGQLDAQGGVARMQSNIGGVMLGVDRQWADGKVVAGGSVGFGSMSTRTRGQQFRGEVEAIDAGVYLDADYGQGFLSASARYTSLDHDTTRSIAGIEGLEGTHAADYRNGALSGHLEHGFNLRTAGGTVWQPLVPVIDYARLDDVDFTEDGVAALTGQHGEAESIRVGAGLQVWKNIETRHGNEVTPHARVLWQKELGDTQVRYMSAFAAEPTLVFGTASQDIGDRSLNWNVGVSSRATDRMSILFDYVGQRTDGSSQHGIALGLGYRF